MNRKEIIKKVIDLCYSNKEGHLGSSLSVLDILYVLYNSYITDFTKEDRNRLILSKGHSSLGFYVILNEFNLLNEDINNFCKFDSNIGGHPSDKLKGVEVSTGSLGHGLPVGIGMAMGYKIQNCTSQIYVVIGDGEMNEGSIWEALLLAPQHNLNNITCILDYNRSNDRALKLDNIENKLKSFNWHCIEVDGHDHAQLNDALKFKHSNKPTFIIANTVKGKGITFMENNPEWHHKIPNEEDYKRIIESLN